MALKRFSNSTKLQLDPEHDSNVTVLKHIQNDLLCNEDKYYPHILQIR